MDAPTKAFFQAEVKGANALCFDCGQKDPQWASCTNGIYICLECSGRHRSIGVHLSFVRCIWMDVWKPQELAMMQFGGNQRLADHLDAHGPKDWRKLPITQKYDTKAAIAYRQQLKAEIASGAPPAPKKAPAPAAPPKPKASLFDLFEDAENVMDSLMAGKPTKQAGYAAEVQKPVRTAEKQKQLDVAAAELKRLQAQAAVEAQKPQKPQEPKVTAPLPTPCAVETQKPKVMTPLPMPCAVEAQKPQVSAGQAVDIWGDDLWD